ncbi:thiamine-phosphate kinase [Acidobacteriota bacterium]
MTETISDIGEFGLIDRIHELIQKEGIQSPGVTLGIGDDTASIRPREGYEVLVTCDSLVEGRHYLPAYTTALDLGRRAMTVNISDIGAMGGTPLYALVSLGLKADTLVSDVESMYCGFLKELNPFQASIIGGNITKTDGSNFIDITLLGEAEKGKLVHRSTAKVGDAILVTGYPGQAVAGLQLLLQSEQSEEFRENPLVRAYITPSHRAREGKAVAQLGYAHAMIDTSDGFLADLGHICEESGTGAVLIQDSLPLNDNLLQAAETLDQDPYELIMKDSDDYELIITCSKDNVEKIQVVISEVSETPVTEVGYITEVRGEIKLILPDGRERQLQPTGWDHFKK